MIGALNDNHTPSTKEERDMEYSEGMIRLLYTTLSQLSLSHLEIDAPSDEDSDSLKISVFDSHTTQPIIYIYHQGIEFLVETPTGAWLKMTYEQVISFMCALSSVPVLTAVFQNIRS